ncbi:protein MpDFR-like19 [Marchantia polymorpha subsp. ruderalis]|uniref:NAD-dependent epimerase/dehydratase domain-containing protein n=2 Tax=Marchantia polymorpha TaxID=3197 RepID=A0A176VSB1_MARPO|nr:hypothetical protein AXG93_4776s1430 [Marchantia polymorpha subsp. ruderalis]PTQ36502.1 hypothetical protein MARPO_0063s0048 [Marchantia polymorpha]BBN19210.1 hypothetical protein Mp_8g08710 [Marchantia polymorpha subsp. ruderalis]|eukprot:PTQ36502.1 hypothetical protein MARPO_0063s0048 [Marchantia polymorpha]
MAVWKSGEKPVAVIGNNGLVGRALVKKLLERGYIVRSAIGSSPDEAAEMMALPGAEERLKLMVRDLLDYANILTVIEGCSSVFLTIPSCDGLNGQLDYPAEAVDAEVRGTLNVVEACANSSIKRMVLTSSASAVVFDINTKTDSLKSVDERNWSNVDFLRKNKLWSALAKTVAEKAAWSLARDRGLDLVVMNPAIVTGPNPKISEGQHSGVLAVARVDVVAAAHIDAAESSQASGRYLCFERLLSDDEALELMKKLFPTLSHKRLQESYSPLRLSNEKLMRLGLTS